jgi:tRNA threonylcarbamoyl adenosine modification protein YjeE
VKKKNLEWQNCSEDSLQERISGILDELASPGALILLEGGLGAGKSSFARALIALLSGPSRNAGSPTFPLVQEYRTLQGRPVYHIDLYRLKSEEELYHSGIAEQIEDESVLTLVEWPSLFPEYFEPFLSGRVARKVALVSIRPGSVGTRCYSITMQSRS